MSENKKPRKNRKEKLIIPRRKPSVVIPPREIVYITPGETICKTCPCFPCEEPYKKFKIVTANNHNPKKLYQIAADVIDAIPMPEAFNWSVEEVVHWVDDVIHFPQYVECIRDNNINGRRLLLLENPSVMPQINMHYYSDIQKFTAHVRKLFGTEFVKFTRSIGLPPRKPWTNVLYFKSKTGPREGMRVNMTASAILRLMDILMPDPTPMDHWDLVFYIPPYFPAVKFARVPWIPTRKWGKKREITQEYTVDRKFRIMPQLKYYQQYIWKEHRPGSAVHLPRKCKIPETPPKIHRPTTGNLMLDRRREPKVKIFY